MLGASLSAANDITKIRSTRAVGRRDSGMYLAARPETSAKSLLRQSYLVPRRFTASPVRPPRGRRDKILANCISTRAMPRIHTAMPFVCLMHVIFLAWVREWRGR